MEPRTGKNEAVLLARTDFVDEEILPRLGRNRPGVAGNALLIEQLPQQLSDRSAYRVDRTGIAAEPPDDPRDIDAAPAGSRRCVLPRSLATGTILSTAVERSIAGLGVIVTISVMGWLDRDPALWP